MFRAECEYDDTIHSLQTSRVVALKTDCARICRNKNNIESVKLLAMYLHFLSMDCSGRI